MESYAGSEPQLALARLETTPALRVLERRNLFSAASYPGTTPHASYDLSPGGRTFVFVRRNAASRIVVIQNLPALVHRAEAR